MKMDYYLNLFTLRQRDVNILTGTIAAIVYGVQCFNNENKKKNKEERM